MLFSTYQAPLPLLPALPVYIEIDFAGYNRLVMCTLIPLKTQNRCFVLFIATQK